MLDRIKPRRAWPVRVAVRAALALALGGAIFGAAVLGAAPGLAQAATPGRSAATSATATPSATARQTIGGPKLSSRGVVVGYAAKKAPRLPGIQASSFVVAEAGTGQVLAAKDPHGYYQPASTLKMLTAVTLIPLLHPNSTVVASKLATSTVPNVVGLVTGRAYKVSDLFTALLTISANDAAIALTQATGSFSKGMTLINAEARQLQADDTAAVEPNGLDAPGQHTSAYDLALIARQALTEPAFLKYDQTLSARFVVKRRDAVTLDNQNSLLTSYQGAIGGKTRLDQRRGRDLRRDGDQARRDAHRHPAALPRADRGQVRGDPAQLGLLGRREGHPGRHAGQPAAAARAEALGQARRRRSGLSRSAPGAGGIPPARRGGRPVGAGRRGIQLRGGGRGRRRLRLQPPPAAPRDRPGPVPELANRS